MNDLNYKSPLPCIHVWEFVRRPEADYFVCRKCNAWVEYDPSEMADYEAEEDYDEAP